MGKDIRGAVKNAGSDAIAVFGRKGVKKKGKKFRSI